MYQLFRRDEKGMALPLAVMMVALIGVMGIGLLIFVQTGLTTALKVNQGQQAFDMADAGVQAAKRQIKIDAATNHYDSVTNPPTNPESSWSYAGAGKTLSLGDCANCINVKIQYLLPSTNISDVRDPDHAPEVVEDRDYFKVISEGKSNGARRKIEAIFFVEGSDVPKAFISKGGVTISGTAELTNMSVFTQVDATINGAATFSGTDLAYGDWNKSPYNTAPRGTTIPGVGAEGDISGAAVPGRDYDGVVPLTSSLKFAKKPTTPEGAQIVNQIHYPFDYRIEPDLEDLRLAALQQNNYYGPGGRGEFAAGATPRITDNTGTGEVKWPTNSTDETVVFVRFASYDNRNKVTWDVDLPPSTNCQDVPPRMGTLVVENGAFVMAQRSVRFKGAVVIRGVPITGAAFTQGGGNTCMEGPVNASGTITIAGKVSPFTLEGGNRPGFYSVQMRSWRELYQ